MNYTVQYARNRGCNVGLDINTTKNIVFCQRQTNRQQKDWNCEENRKNIMEGYGLSNCNSAVTYCTINPRFAKCPVIGFSYFKDFVFESSISHLAVISQWIFRYQISTVWIGRRPKFRPTFAVIIFSDNGIFVRVSKVFHIDRYFKRKYAGQPLASHRLVSYAIPNR